MGMLLPIAGQQIEALVCSTTSCFSHVVTVQWSTKQMGSSLIDPMRQF